MAYSYIDKNNERHLINLVKNNRYDYSIESSAERTEVVTDLPFDNILTVYVPYRWSAGNGQIFRHVTITDKDTGTVVYSSNNSDWTNTGDITILFGENVGGHKNHGNGLNIRMNTKRNLRLSID